MEDGGPPRPARGSRIEGGDCLARPRLAHARNAECRLCRYRGARMYLVPPASCCSVLLNWRCSASASMLIPHEPRSTVKYLSTKKQAKSKLTGSHSAPKDTRQAPSSPSV